MHVYEWEYLYKYNVGRVWRYDGCGYVWLCAYIQVYLHRHLCVYLTGCMNVLYFSVCMCTCVLGMQECSCVSTSGCICTVVSGCAYMYISMCWKCRWVCGCMSVSRCISTGVKKVHLCVYGKHVSI